jgi:hypothetical protein
VSTDLALSARSGFALLQPMWPANYAKKHIKTLVQLSPIMTLDSACTPFAVLRRLHRQ